MFWFVGNEIVSFELYVRKSSDLVFPRKVRCFKLHNTKKFFGYLAPKLGSLSFISQKTAILLFCLLKHVALTQRSVRRKVVLFPALLHGKRFPSSLQRVTLLFCWLYSKQRFFLWLAKWQRFASFWPGYAVFSIIFVRTASIAFSLFNCLNTLFSA